MEHLLSQGAALGPERELEGRIKGPLLHKASIRRLLALYQDWIVTTYEEQRSRIVGMSAVYRSIDGGPIVMKTKVDRIREEWYTVVLSTEEEVQDMTLVSRYFATIQKQRWSRMETKNLRLDVTHFIGTDIYQVEVEAVRWKHMKKFQMYLKYVVDVLLDSPLYISRKRYELARELVMEKNPYPGTCIQVAKGIYQKPVTLEYEGLKELVTRVKDLWITPKVDGTRVFLLIFNTMIYSIDLTGHIRLLAMGTPYTSSVCSIIDTEYTHGEYSGMDPDGDSLGGCSKDTLHGRYHAFDLAIPGEHTLVHRLQLLEDIVDKIKDHVPVVIKEYHRIQYPGDRIDAIKCYWKKMSQRNVDGMIFVDGSREYLGDVYKWKPVTTVDLLIRNEKELYAAHGKHIPELALDTGGVTVIDDTVYEMELCRGGVAKIVRARKDKPSPNSIRVVLSNIRACALGNIWDEDSCHLLRIYHSRIRKELMGKSALDITGKNIHQPLSGKYSTVCLSFVLNRYVSRIHELFSNGLFCKTKRLVGIFMDGDRVPMEETHDGYTIIPVGDDRYKIRIGGTKIDTIEKRFRVKDLDMFTRYGFKSVETKVLGTDELCLSSGEKTLSNMFTSFVLTKKSTS